MARIAAGMAYVFSESGLPEYGLTQSQRAKEYYRQAQDERSYNRQIMLIGYTQFLLKTIRLPSPNWKRTPAFRVLK